MAVPTGSGTETIHAHMFADVDNIQALIIGVQQRSTQSRDLCGINRVVSRTHIRL